MAINFDNIYTQAFDVYQVGNYPFETFFSTPSAYDAGVLGYGIKSSSDINATDGGGDGGQYALRNHIRYQKRPNNQIIDPYSQRNDYNSIVYYISAGSNSNLVGLFADAYQLSATTAAQYDYFDTLVPILTFTDDGLTAIAVTSIWWNVSSMRQLYRTPAEFQLFYLQDPNQNANDSYGYLLYPNKIFLNPLQMEKSSTTGYWRLTTTTNLINWSSIYLYSQDIESDAFYIHNNIYRQNLPILSVLSSINSSTNYQLHYDIKFSNTVIDKTVFTFGTKTTNKAQATTAGIYPAGVKHLMADSLMITYSGYYVDPLDASNLVSVKQDMPDIYLNDNSDGTSGRYQFFTSSYILNYNNIWQPSVKTKYEQQVFQLIEYQLDNTKVLAALSNCVSKVTVDLNTLGISYINPYSKIARTYPYSKLGLSYMIEMDQTPITLPLSVAPKNRKADQVLSTLTKFDLIDTATHITTACIDNIVNRTYNKTTNPTGFKNNNYNFTISNITNKFIVWETKYAPHFYSYRINLSAVPSKNMCDYNNLNFYLKTDVTNPDDILAGSNTVYLSSYISSDYCALQYDLATGSPNDYIKYKFINVDTDLITTLSAAYGPSYNIPYNFNIYYDKTGEITGYDTPYVPASTGQYFKIDYPKSPYGQIEFSIRSTLSSLAAGTIDAFDATHITLAKNQAQSDSAVLFLDVLAEDSNTITIDSSFNITEDTWPSRDLTNSNICWYYTPSATPNVTINAVDANGVYIQSIDPYATVPFSDQTWTVTVSGYGPKTISIYLSSDKYTQISDPTNTDNTLFDYFAENTFIIGTSVDLNNLNKTRTVQLTAMVPFQGTLYPIPTGVPLNWTWQYDAEMNPVNQPIQLTLPLSSNAIYNYSDNIETRMISAVNVNVTPSVTYLNRPAYHEVKVTLSTDIKSPTISGEYSFYLDDFPPSELLNADFKTYYYKFSDDKINSLIADSRETTNVITRPKGTDINFLFEPYTDLDTISIIKYASKYWTVQGVVRSPNVNDTWLQLDLNTITPTQITPTVSSINISYNLSAALIKGWGVPHNITTSTTLYIIDANEFNKPLQFITYPEYAWLNSKNLTLLTTSNYTQSYAPSAYGNKLSDSQTFWLSANKNYFTKYNYQNGSEYSVVSASSALQLLDIPYINTDPIIATSGLSITLTAYNDTYYTQDNGITFIMPVGGTLTTNHFNITAQTIPYSNSLPSNKFLLSPLILPYSNLQLTFNVQTTSLNLDTTKTIIITQKLSSVNPNAPSIIAGGTVNYYLSSHYWTVSSSVPAVSGTYNVFELNIGDPYVPLYSGDLGVDNYYLYATTSVVQKISSSTFINYPSYTGNTDLWREITL
jgi:hypothetical protein